MQNIKLVREVVMTFFFEEVWVQSKLNENTIFDNIDLILNSIIETPPGNKYRLVNFWLSFSQYNCLAELMAKAMQHTPKYSWQLFEGLDLFHYKKWIDDSLFLGCMHELYDNDEIYQGQIHELYLSLHDSITLTKDDVMKKIYKLDKEKFPIFIMLLNLRNSGIRAWIEDELEKIASSSARSNFVSDCAKAQSETDQTLIRFLRKLHSNFMESNI